MTEPIVITIHYQARVKPGVKLNMHEEPAAKSKVDGQLFGGAVVSVVDPEPQGPDELVQVVYAAWVSRKFMEKINDG